MANNYFYVKDDVNKVETMVSTENILTISPIKIKSGTVACDICYKEFIGTFKNSSDEDVPLISKIRITADNYMQSKETFCGEVSRFVARSIQTPNASLVFTSREAQSNVTLETISPFPVAAPFDSNKITSPELVSLAPSSVIFKNQAEDKFVLTGLNTNWIKPQELLYGIELLEGEIQTQTEVRSITVDSATSIRFTLTYLPGFGGRDYNLNLLFKYNDPAKTTLLLKGALTVTKN